MKQFATRLNELLQEQGRGAASALARACGVDRAYISRLQHGTATAPSDDVIRAAANHFGVNVKWLRDGQEPRLHRLKIDEASIQEPSAKYQVRPGSSVVPGVFPLHARIMGDGGRFTADDCIRHQ